MALALIWTIGRTLDQASLVQDTQEPRARGYGGGEPFSKLRDGQPRLITDRQQRLQFTAAHAGLRSHRLSGFGQAAFAREDQANAAIQLFISKVKTGVGAALIG